MRLVPRDRIVLGVPASLERRVRRMPCEAGQPPLGQLHELPPLERQLGLLSSRVERELHELPPSPIGAQLRIVPYLPPVGIELEVPPPDLLGLRIVPSGPFGALRLLVRVVPLAVAVVEERDLQPPACPGRRALPPQFRVY
jgi:hypothetical protein